MNFFQITLYFSLCRQLIVFVHLGFFLHIAEDTTYKSLRGNIQFKLQVCVDKEAKWNLAQSSILLLVKNTEDRRKVSHMKEQQGKYFWCCTLCHKWRKEKIWTEEWLFPSLPFTSSLSCKLSFLTFFQGDWVIRVFQNFMISNRNLKKTLNFSSLFLC